jgi:CheY-like chemotaxis protein
MKLPLHIIIIDDDTQHNKEHTEILKQNGISACIKTVLNGSHALLYLEQNQHVLSQYNTLILLDTQMPIMNGFEFIEKVKNCPYLPKNKLVIAMMLNQNTKHDIDRAKNMGVQHFIQKPCCPQAVNKIIQESFSYQKVA